jgi:hypothetical protein
MQLYLNADELHLFATTLLERVGAMDAPRLSAVQRNANIGQDARCYDDLLDKVLASDLRLDSDELEQVADLLGAQKRDLKDEIAGLRDSALLLNLQEKLELVERILQRVEDACATL